MTLPTPPSSTRSTAESEEEEPRDEEAHPECLSVKQPTGLIQQYLPIRQLGQGTFSKVVLATGEKKLPTALTPRAQPHLKSSIDESNLNPKKLVAIKIVEYGPAGGADEERVELSLRREVELMRAISHPSLVQLRAFDESSTAKNRCALLVLGFCPGGDLFELASQGQAEVLGEPMCRRVFAELVDAVAYLHGMEIVHRDIKLESTYISNLHLLRFSALKALPRELPNFTTPLPSSLV